MRYLHSPSTEVADSDLIQRAFVDDQDAFESLVLRYYPMICKFAYRCLKDYDYALDVSQHVFLKLYLSMSKAQADMAAPRGEKTIKAWLFQVAWHRCIDELRKKEKYILFSEMHAAEAEYLLEEIPDPGPSPEEITEGRDLQGLLAQAIQSLPARYRLVAILRCTRQMTYEEIGKTLNMPVGRVKAFYSRARPLLQTELLSALRS